jgi:hypothetical protein
MILPLLLPIHIVAAALGLISGVFALSVAKGGVLHRKSGMVFAYAMIAMCLTATCAAIVKGQAVNLVAALTTAYLVATGLLTVRPRSAVSRRRDLGLMLVALALGVTTIAAGLAAIAGATGKVLGYSPGPFFGFGVLGLAGGLGDWRMIRSGSRRGAPRLARHLWRMCMALFIAAASFFSVRARVAAIFPASFANSGARALPVVLVLLVMFYWLWRIRSRAIPARA